MAAQVGIEPTTKWLTVTCSAAELLGKNGGMDGTRTRSHQRDRLVL